MKFAIVWVSLLLEVIIISSVQSNSQMCRDEMVNNSNNLLIGFIKIIYEFKGTQCVNQRKAETIEHSNQLMASETNNKQTDIQSFAKVEKIYENATTSTSTTTIESQLLVDKLQLVTETTGESEQSGVTYNDQFDTIKTNYNFRRWFNLVRKNN